MDDYYDEFDYEENDFDGYQEDDCHEDDVYDYSEDSDDVNDSNEQESRYDYDIGTFELGIGLAIGEEIAGERRKQAIIEKIAGNSFLETEHKKESEYYEYDQQTLNDAHTSYPKKT